MLAIKTIYFQKYFQVYSYMFDKLKRRNNHVSYKLCLKEDFYNSGSGEDLKKSANHINIYKYFSR